MVHDKKALLVGAFTVATLLLAACGANSGDTNANATSVSSTGSAISTSVAPSETGTSSVADSSSLTDTNGLTESNGQNTTGTESTGSGLTNTNGVSTTGTETAGSGVSATNGLTESNGTSSAVSTETPSALVTSTESSSVVGSTSEVTSTSEAVSTTTSGSSGTSGSNGGTATTSGTPEAMPSTLNGNLVSSLFTAFAQALTNNAAVTPTGTTENAQPYTVFVPTGQAFDQLGATLLSGVATNGNSTDANGTTGLLNNSVLAQVFSYHIVKGRYTATDLAKVTELTTLSGLTLTVSNKDGTIYINNARVVQADVQNNGPASNTSGSTNQSNQGAIHMIDSVLVPPDLNGLNNGSGSSSGVGSSTTTTDTNSSLSSTPTATP